MRRARALVLAAFMLPPLTLLVLAAGMGSRYGGLKQLDPVGPSGETVLDYGVYDALRAGFKRIVFIIRNDFEAQFREQVGTKYTGHIAVDYAYQSLNALPDGYRAPEDRIKPWGTGHAVWCARPLLDGPFAVINADDFYGADSFVKLAQFLQSEPTEPTDTATPRATVARAAMIGFRLKNTLSENGAVSRGICRVDAADRLQSIEEHKGILAAEVGGSEGHYSGEEITSMNCWGFAAPAAAFLDGLDTQLRGFLDTPDHALDEFYLPTAISALIAQEKAHVRIFPTTSQWFGVTYREDRAQVVARLDSLVTAGEYPRKLFP